MGTERLLASGSGVPAIRRGRGPEPRNRPLVWLTARTPENIVVNLPDVADVDLRDWLDR